MPLSRARVGLLARLRRTLTPAATGLPKASNTCTVIGGLTGVATNVFAGWPTKESWAAVLDLTRVLPDWPSARPAELAVTDCGPAVLRTGWNVCTPLSTAVKV